MSKLKSFTWLNQAREIMNRVIVIDDVSYLGAVLPESIREPYHLVPYSVDELERAAKQDLILVAMPTISLIRLYHFLPKLFSAQDWFLDQPFVQVNSQAGYHLVRPEIKGSANENWSTQLRLQPKGYCPLLAVELAYMAAVVLKDCGEKLFEFTRCSSQDSAGNHVCVGVLNREISLSSYHDTDCWSNLAISSGQFRTLGF